MAFTVVTTTSSGNGTSHTVAIPDGAASGKRVEVWFSSDGNPTITLPTGSTWTRYFTDVTVSDATLSVFYRDLDGTEGFSGTGDTISVSTSVTERTAHASYLISGHDTGTAPEGTSSTGTSETPDPPNLDPAGWASEESLWICGAGLRFAGSFTAAPANYTNLLNLQTAGADAGATIGSARRILDASAENPGGFTQNGGSMLWVAGTTVHRPAAGGTSGTATPAVITLSASLPAVTTVAGVTVTPAAVSLSAALPAPTPAAGAAATPAAVALAANLPAASATGGGAGTATPSVIAATATLPAPAVSASAGPAAVSLAALVPAAAGTGGGTATPGVVAVASTVPDVGVDAAAGPAVTATSAAMPAPGVQASAGPAAIAGALAVPAVTASGGSLGTATPAVITLAASLAAVGASGSAGPAAIPVALTIPAATSTATFGPYASVTTRTYGPWADGTIGPETHADGTIE